jgi:hypothetical protein
LHLKAKASEPHALCDRIRLVVHIENVSGETIGLLRSLILKKLAVIAAVMGFMAVLFSCPATSFAWSSGKYAKQLLNANCSGQPYDYRNGCNAYFAKRLDKQNTPDAALGGCKSWCGNNYSNPTKVSECQAACQNMRNNE